MMNVPHRDRDLATMLTVLRSSWHPPFDASMACLQEPLIESLSGSYIPIVTFVLAAALNFRFGP